MECAVDLRPRCASRAARGGLLTRNSAHAFSITCVACSIAPARQAAALMARAAPLAPLAALPAH
jgi:hypothetical protein